MDSRIITITGAAHKHGNLNISSCGREFFPEDAFGASARHIRMGTPITLRVEGLNKPIKTDIPTDAKSGRPRGLFRKRGWVREFVRINGLCPEDKVTINRISERTYRIQPIYTKVDQPTAPSEVTPATPLQRLNLNWSEKELPEKVRTKHVHRLHPYLGKFIPQLVEIFLRKYFSPGQTVLDPFAGSCTTLVQANELGINSIGYDVSAFNILLGRVKTAKYDLLKTRKEVFDILNKVRSVTQTGSSQRPLFAQDIPDSLKNTSSSTDNEYLQKWFAPQSLRELLAYRYFIETGEYENLDLLKIILSRSARSARLTTHFDLDFPKRPQTQPYWCYKHSRTCSPTKTAFKFLRRYSIDTLERIEEFATLRTDAGVQLKHADSRKVDIPPVDGIITSPPYVGLIDYHDQHAYSYHLLGLQNNCHNEIGPASKGRSESAKRQYQQDIAKVFRRAIDAMPSGGHVIVVAADRANLYGRIRALVEVEVEGFVQRHVNRRTGRRAGNFYESVFIWRKR